MTPRTVQHHRQSSGFTMVELLMAIAGMSMIALAISGMMTAVAYGTSSTRDLRILVVKQRAVAARLNAAIRGSKMILEEGTRYLVLWTHDENEDDLPNVGEIRRIEYNANTLQIVSYKANWDSMSQNAIDTANISYALTSNFDTATTALKTQSYFPVEIWATQVNGWVTSLDNTTDQQAVMIGYQVTFDLGLVSDTAIGTAALRSE